VQDEVEPAFPYRGGVVLRDPPYAGEEIGQVYVRLAGDGAPEPRLVQPPQRAPGLARGRASTRDHQLQLHSL